MKRKSENKETGEASIIYFMAERMHAISLYNIAKRKFKKEMNAVNLIF